MQNEIKPLDRPINVFVQHRQYNGSSNQCICTTNTSNGEKLTIDVKKLDTQVDLT